jgi:hypothetical protein
LPETGNHQDHTLAVHNLNAHKVNTWAKNKQEEGFFIYLLDRGAISPGKESQVFWSSKFGIDIHLIHKLHIFQVRILWFKNCKVDCFEFYKLWSSSAFKLLSEKKRLNPRKDSMHRYGTDGHVARLNAW